MKTFLYEVRTQRHLTLSQLSLLSGVSETHINDIENEKKIPSVKILCQLAKALEVPITDLFTCED